MRLFAWLLFLPLISPAAGDQWIRLNTPHFEMYTSAGEGKGREAILYFEQVRSFFLLASPSKHVPDFPVRIIAFRGEKQYQPYRINESAVAYYTGSHDRDYIVMQDVSIEHYPVAIHEYMHLIVRHSGLELPVWMNEGWAELYSTLRPVGNKARVGDLKPGWLQTLAMEKWLPLQTLTAVDHKSPLYNEKNKAGIFYAESWALMHMLYFDDHYRPHFNSFVAALAGGKSFGEASQAVYSMSMAQMEKDLKSYFTMHKLYAATVDVKLAKSEEEPSVARLSEFDSQLALADLLVVTRKTERAKEALTALAAQHPERPDVEESLGYLAWQTGDNEGARMHFAKAIAAGTENAQLCYHYALMEHSDKSLDAFRRAVQLKPDFTDARMQLGFALMDRHDYEGAFAAFTYIKSVKPEQASRLFSAKAYALLKMGKLEEARKNAEFASKWARTPAETEQSSSILRYLDGADASKKSGKPVAIAGRGAIPALEETSAIETTTPAGADLGNDGSWADEVRHCGSGPGDDQAFLGERSRFCVRAAGELQDRGGVCAGSGRGEGDCWDCA
jgi:tetratricopeptide (TPR) repeat protein